jgi:excisionase family DNA binding protein
MPRDEAFKECVAIVRLLVNLDTKYKKLRKLAIDDPPTFYKEVSSFARELHEARQRIREFTARYSQHIDNLKLDYKNGTFEIKYIGQDGQVETNGPLKINPYLLRELDIPSFDTPNVNEVLHEAILSQASEEIEFLRPKEAAKLLKVSYKTLWRWWKEGKIKAIQIGPSKRLRYYKKDIEKLISEDKPK